MMIEIIIDPGCPWCFIGTRQLARALTQRPDVTVRRRWWPFLLNPDMPHGGLDRSEYLIRKFGSDARVSRVHRAIGYVGRTVGINFNFNRITRTPRTVNAHRLIRHADAFGCADQAVEALFTAYFVEGQDIGNLDALLAIGDGLGLNVAGLHQYLQSDADLNRIYEENARAHRLGINGVPAFVFDGSFFICGAQEPNVLACMIDVAREANVLAYGPPEAMANIEQMSTTSR